MNLKRAILFLGGQKCKQAKGFCVYNSWVIANDVTDKGDERMTVLQTVNK
jgi:hypothetical protein